MTFRQKITLCNRISGGLCIGLLLARLAFPVLASTLVVPVAYMSGFAALVFSMREREARQEEAGRPERGDIEH